jgi:acetate kinase
MIVLVLNPGSGSLKCELIAGEPNSGERITGRKLADDVIQPVRDYGDATREMLQRIDDGRFRDVQFRLKDVDLLACRVVHGGDRYTSPSRIDDELIRAIEELDDLAPLHNAACAATIRAARSVLGPRVPSVAVFDTAFHASISMPARTYAIPRDLAARYGIRRYGFHGLAHQYLTLRYAELTGTPLDRTNIITFHLGGGASAAAIEAGKSIDTSMGFTPLEGLVMSTRCGDLDPGIIAFLSRKERVGIDVVENWLNKKSGLLGISGRSQDTRELVRHAADDPGSELALSVYAYRIKKYIGAYLAILGHASAIVFGGVISENTPDVRRRICEGLESFGLDFDSKVNSEVLNREGRISGDGSRLQAYVIPSEEGLMMAHEAMRCYADSIPETEGSGAQLR